MRVSQRNKRNRAKQLINHCCGRKTFQCVSYDKRNPETGKEPNLQQLWQITHIKKNGDWVDEGSKKVDEKVSELVHEKLQGIEEGTDPTLIINAAFESTVGYRSGYCRGRGKGPRPTNSTSVELEAIQEQLAAQQREANEARRQTNEVLTTLVGVRAQLVEEHQMREDMEARFNDRQREMQERMGNQFQEAMRALLSQVGLSNINVNLDFSQSTC